MSSFIGRGFVFFLYKNKVAHCRSFFLLATQPLFLLKPPRYNEYGLYVSAHCAHGDVTLAVSQQYAMGLLFCLLLLGPNFIPRFNFYGALVCRSQHGTPSLHPQPPATCCLQQYWSHCHAESPLCNGTPLHMLPFQFGKVQTPFPRFAQFLMCRHPNSNLASTIYPTLHGSIPGYGSPEVYADAIFCASNIGVVPPRICRFPNG
jgi:hypothetical protein